MVFTDIPVPDIYKESADFRLLMKWIELCFSQVQFDTDNLIDLLDPLRCPSDLLWMLGDTCGYKYDERVSVAFNRLVIMYFSRMIRYRGSETGMALAAEINLAQFNLNKYAEENPILSDRLEDTSIPANSVSVTANKEKGFIDVVYYSENNPIDVCTEYVRPIGMYCFAHAGISVNARTKVSVDARLTNLNDGRIFPGPAFVAHYRREDYARLQSYLDTTGELIVRRPVHYRNMDAESRPLPEYINPGYRSLYSLQLCNNEHIVKALLPSLEEPEKIFSTGYEPQDFEVHYPDNYFRNIKDREYNLRIDRELEESLSLQVYTVEKAETPTTPKPAVNPPMMCLGDAISLNADNTKYTRVKRSTGKIIVDRVTDN